MTFEPVSFLTGFDIEKCGTVTGFISFGGHPGQILTPFGANFGIVLMYYLFHYLSENQMRDASGIWIFINFFGVLDFTFPFLSAS
jgi:hypothetical protein